MDKGHKHFLLEEKGPSIIDTYIKHRDELALSDTMWLLWLANLVPVGSSLVYLSAAMENLMTAWFKSTKSKLGGTYMPPKEWDPVIKGPLDILQTNLIGNQYSDRILRKVNNANNFGPNERFEYFFDEISLPIGDVEKSAIKARNRFAHGIEKDVNKIENIVAADRAFKTLLNRSLLKVLGYDGEYIDYSSYSHPTRKLNEPIGGRDGDRKPITL